jgi:hypothetical protein
MQTSATQKQLALTKTADLRQLTKEAKQFYAEAESARSIVENGAMTALENAWQCGKRLNAIKAIIGHGNWLTWLENHWPELTERTSQLYMKIDNVNPKARRVSDLEFDTIRKHRLTFVPDKEQPNKHRDVKLERLATLGNLVNEYERLKYRHQQGLQRLNFEKVRKETVDLYQFLQWLHGDRDRNPWDENRTPRHR